MPISMYEASIPTFTRYLANMDRILDKAQAHADAKKFDSIVLVRARLAPDMFDLARQVQIASDMAKNGTARLTGSEIPKYEDNEATIPELKARIAKTLAFVGGYSPGQFEGSETRPISIRFPNGTSLDFNGRDYLLGFVLPNFYFHASTMYDILRHNGVELGKSDFMGA